MAPNYSFVLLFLEILNNCLLVLSSPDLSVSSESLEQVPPSPVITLKMPTEFNFKQAKLKAEAFYKTLPETALTEATMLVSELINVHGYPCETHKVTTSDGYILTMHRIPYGQNKKENREVVYLQHGLLSSSADWIISGPEKGFGYILADAGYDVWMPNVRGNRYSRSHTILDRDDDEFWDFSWQEIGRFDVTAMIDYVLKETKQEKLFYIGHSQGTTVFYAMCSEKPEYNEKIRAHFSLAPLAYASHITSPLLNIIAAGASEWEIFLNMVGIKEFLPNTGFLGKVGNILCKEKSVMEVLCTNALFAIAGFDHQQMNETLLPIIMGHTPAGCSVKQLLHYGQLINSGKFQAWNYGTSGNEKFYNNTLPPTYLLSKVTSPVYLYYSKNDWVSAETDVLKLAGELSNVQEKILVKDGQFNHVDYLFGIDAREYVYDDVIIRMKKH
ncbi:hypothetical protein ILUMI_04630 [Ignelater luminosus]|uniref:Partial AB-hydrolase lipase domain-containing protein n=1 Tax=Ignelater luminosus TaxID=2038154 RepID=A0A8K0DEE6_IGNLU|nr:hypothetical protein ILUMI_04630 [Ignelater luminosus]